MPPADVNQALKHWDGGGGDRIRADVNGDVKFLWNFGGGGGGGGGQDRCERRSEVSVKIQKKKFGGGGGGGSGWEGVRLDVKEELKFLRKLKKNKTFFFLGGGGRVGGSGWMWTKNWSFCEKLKKQIGGGGQGCSGLGGGGGGGQGGCERRIEVLVKIQNEKNWEGGGSGRG